MPALRRRFPLLVNRVNHLLQLIQGDVSIDGALRRAVSPEPHGPSDVGDQQVGDASRLVRDRVALVLLPISKVIPRPVLTFYVNSDREK